MAIVRWIWGNINSMIPAIQEYQVRICDEQFKPYRDKLIRLSNRMVSVGNRNGSNATACCWFAGYLAPNLYFVALGGEQNSILKTRYTGTRGLFGVMGLGFTDEDIHLYRQTDALFDSLKQILRKLHETGKYEQGAHEVNLVRGCKTYIEDELQIAPFEEIYNIFPSEPRKDLNLWNTSLVRPVMTGILTTQDAKLLLNEFQDGIVTVRENICLRYSPREELSAVQRHLKKQRQESAKQVKKSEDVARKENLKSQDRAENHQNKLEIIWSRVICAVIIIGVVIYGIAKIVYGLF